MQQESEFEKQKALLDQKITHLESNLESSKAKEKELNDELKQMKKELINSIKDNSSKYET